MACWGRRVLMGWRGVHERPREAVGMCSGVAAGNWVAEAERRVRVEEGEGRHQLHLKQKKT